MRAPAAVDQHQRLLVVDAGVAHALALPAAGVDQPAGGQLDAAVGHGVMHQLGVAADDVLALLGRDGGVLEEAAGVADDGRIGQLGAADGDDPVVNLARVGRADAAVLRLALELQVAQYRLPGPGQRQAHAQDQRAPGQAEVARLRRRVLEHRVAIAKTALRGVQGEDFATGQVDGVQLVKAVLQLDAVGADVLHRAGAHGAGDQRQVLQAGQALLQRPADEVVPVLARAGLDDGVARGLAEHATAGHLDLEHHALDVAGQHDVAAAAQHEAVLRGQFGVGQHGAHVVLAAHAHHAGGARRDAKAVEGLQGDVALDEHGTIVASGFCMQR